MRKIISKLLKISGPDLRIEPQESRIFDFLQEVRGEVPRLSGGKWQVPPVIRCAGGWVRDKLLGKPSKDMDITVDQLSHLSPDEHSIVHKAFEIQEQAVERGEQPVPIETAVQSAAAGSKADLAKIIGAVKHRLTGKEFAEIIQLFDQERGTRAISRINTTESRPEQIKNLSVAFLKIYGQEIEILGCRGKEVYRPGDRNPVSIRIGTSVDDAIRRDLTINSMFYNLGTRLVEDLTRQGFEDLSTMTLRTPLEPNQTFKDDPLRVLRVLRFYARYPNAKIAPETMEAMKNPEVQHQIVRKMVQPTETHGIVVERTADELRKIMVSTRPEAAIKAMYDVGLLQKMLNLPPSFNPLNMDQRNRHHKMTVIDHTIHVLKNVNNLCKEYGLTDPQRMKMNITALMHDLGKLDPRSQKVKPDGTMGFMGDPNNPQSLSHQQISGDVWKSFGAALKMSDEEMTSIHDLIVNHMNPHGHVETDQGPPTDKSLRKYIRNNPSWVFQYIHAMADAMSKSEEANAAAADPYKANLQRLRELAPSADSFGRQTPQNDLLNGKEIIGIVGLPPNPPKGLPGYVEVVKERIREEQDGNPGLTKDQAIQIVHQMMNSGELDAYNRKR